jgi:WXG100 family type VII secretion target
MGLRTTPFSGAPAGGGFQTDLGVMTASHQFVLQKRDEMVSEVNSLMARLEAMDRSKWDGEAATAFVTARQQWQDVIGRVHSSLNDVGMGLHGSHRQYGQTEQDNQAGITNVVRGI